MSKYRVRFDFAASGVIASMSTPEFDTEVEVMAAAAAVAALDRVISGVRVENMRFEVGEEISVPRVEWQEMSSEMAASDG